MNLQELLTLFKEEEAVFVKFHAPWCGVCKLLTPYVEAQKTDLRFSKVKFVDVDVEACEDIKEAFKINNLPYFTGVKKGRVIKEFTTSKKNLIDEVLKELI
tara:strand:+ start:312 stop:614 length:303 start_codon:yes stop_codon:yes gene_type:complete